MVLFASLAAAWGFATQPNAVVIVPPPPVLILPAPTSTELVRQASTTVRITVATPIFTSNPGTSTIRASSSSLPSSPPPLPQKVKTLEQAKTPEPKPKQSPTPDIFTVQSILDRTAFSLNQRIDGAYRLTLHTTTTAYSGLDWDLSQRSIGGTGQVPKFDTAFSCDPQPDTPAADSPDQNPLFGINTSYTCIISLTDPLVRQGSKKISFLTGAGRLVVKASSLDTTLKSNKNTNGFVLDNQSAVPITVTGVTFDVSFTALNTSFPLIFRFIKPDDESILAEYPLQDLPADSGRPQMKKGANMKASFSFVVKGRSQRLLPVEIVNVQPLTLIGLNPEITVTLRQVDIDRSDIKATLFSPIISWSCIVYDPYHAGGLPNEQNCR